MSAPPPPSLADAARPETWRIDAGDLDVATLHVPPVMRQHRVLEIDVRFVVRALADAASSWLAVQVDIDGARQWARRIDAHRAGEVDSLDYHCRRELPAGQALRIRAVTQLGGALRQRLVIEAEQQSE